MTKTVIDFDAFRAEKEQTEIWFKIGRSKYRIAPVLPAGIVLKVVRLKRDLGNDADVTLDVFESFGRAVFGDQWEGLLDNHQIGFDELPKLVEAVISAYTPKAETPMEDQT